VAGQKGSGREPNSGPTLGFSMANGTVYGFDYSRQANAEELAETVVQIFLGGLFSPANEKE